MTTRNCTPAHRAMRTTAGSLGELALIERIKSRLPHRDDVLVGAGDDCAVVRPTPQSAEDWVLKSDPVICGRHFLPDSDPRQVGHKAVGRVLSDLASMGAQPRWAVLDLVLTPETDVVTLDALYDGMLELAARHGLAIVGGDTAQGSELALHVFACGTLPAGSARLRSGARAGDAVYVTGELGGSLVGKHLTFEPRVTEGIWLRDWVNAMIDISDGLASELWHLANASAAKVEIEAEAVPISPAARRAASPLQAALQDGEDFELLFTLPAAHAPRFETAWRQRFPELACTRIGRVLSAAAESDIATDGDTATTADTPLGAVRIRTCGRVQTLPRRGYEHLSGGGAL